MNLKQIVLGLGILGGGGTFSYMCWNYFPQNTDYERDIVRPLITIAVGLTSAVAGGKLIGEGTRKENDENNKKEKRYKLKN